MNAIDEYREEVREIARKNTELYRDLLDLTSEGHFWYGNLGNMTPWVPMVVIFYGCAVVAPLPRVIHRLFQR